MTFHPRIYRMARGLALTIALASLAVGVRGSEWPRTATAVAGLCVIYCGGTDLGCDPGQWEKAIDFEPKNRSGASHAEQCYNFYCFETHPCGVEPIIGDITRAIESRDVTSIVRLLDAEAAVSLNLGRGALQVLSCSGDVAGHLPVDGAFVSEIVAQLR